MLHRAPFTLIEPDGGYAPGARCTRHETRGNEHLPIAAYATPSDVPVPLRHMLREAHVSGLTLENLSLLYELPLEWLQLFALPSEGRA